MSHFYGTLQGQRGEATRCGSKASGLTAIAASWRGAVEVTLYEQDGKDRFKVEQRTWQGAGIREVIAEGVIGEPRDHCDDVTRMKTALRHAVEQIEYLRSRLSEKEQRFTEPTTASVVAEARSALGFA